VVGHVKIVGILMLVHGILIFLVGAGLITFAVIAMTSMPAPPGGGPEPYIIGGMYGGFGLMFVACGLLQAIAGVRVMSFKNRVLGLVALFSNALVLMSCYCAITGVGLMIYGLIVLFNADVARAFEMVTRGATAEEAIRRYTPRYGDDRDDYDEMSDPRRQWEEERRRRRDDEGDLRTDAGDDDRPPPNDQPTPK
jgi:hypothetical protein